MALERGSNGVQTNAAGTTAGTTPTGVLLVRRNPSGTLAWEAKWRTESGRQVKKTVGLAHLKRRPTPLVLDPTEASEGWQANYLVPRSPANGALLPDEARARMREIISEHATETVLKADESALVSFDALVADWLQERRHDVQDGTLRRSTLRDYESMLVDPDAPLPARAGNKRRSAWLMREFSGSRVDEISLKRIEAFEARLRTSDLAPRTRLKYSIVLGMVLSHAVRKEVITANPMAGRGRRKGGRIRKPMISVYDITVVEAIADKAGNDVGEIIRLAATSGLRMGELLALRWKDIKPDAIHVRERFLADDEADEDEDTPKSGASRTLPLPEQAADALDRVRERDEWTRPNDLVFGRQAGDKRRGTEITWEHRDASEVRKQYKQARDKVIAGTDLPLLRFHDLRHTFGSTLASAGIPLSTIKVWMGHADISTTMVYIHFQPQSDDAARMTSAFTTKAPRAKVLRIKAK